MQGWIVRGQFAIYDKFMEHKIEMPFPQRDLHTRSGVLGVRGGRSAQNGERELTEVS